MPRATEKFIDNRKFLVLCGLLVILLSLANIATAIRTPQEIKVLAASTVNPTEQQIEFWKEIVRNHPTYRDGYLELAKLYMGLDLRVAAKEAVEVAIGIDPHSDQAKQLAQQLE